MAVHIIILDIWSLYDSSKVSIVRKQFSKNWEHYLCLKSIV